jgi:hypothetical protein
MPTYASYIEALRCHQRALVVGPLLLTSIAVLLRPPTILVPRGFEPLFVGISAVTLSFCHPSHTVSASFQLRGKGWPIIITSLFSIIYFRLLI